MKGHEALDWMGQDGDLVVIVACLSNMKIVCCWCDALGSSKDGLSVCALAHVS